MELTKFRDQLFAEGEKLGFTELELYYEKQESFGCDIFKGEIDNFESSSVSGVSVRGLYNGKMGYAYTEKLDEESIEFLLKSAKENAGLIEDDPEELFSGDAEYKKANFYSPSLEEVTAEQKIALLKEIEEKIYAYDPRVVQTNYATLQNFSAETAIYNNKGLSLTDRNNFLYVLFSVVVKEGDEIKSGMTIKVTKDFASLNADEIAKEAVEKALSYLGGKTYPNKTYPVILKNEAAASLITVFSSSFSADAVQKGQSRLKGKLGEKIASDLVTFIDDPFLPEGIRSSTFDSEGVPTEKLTVVDKGQLQTYFYNMKTAKKDGVKSNGHGTKYSYKGTIGVAPSNFFIEPKDKSFDELVASIEEGVIVTGLSGLHSGANPISGDFSVAATGYFIKDGKIEGATNYMTIAGNFFELLLDVVEVGSDLEFSTQGIGSPSLKVKGLTVTID